MVPSEYKTVRASQSTLTELMIPSYANFGGKIHGGILLSLMDKIAYVCAAKHAGGYCVTVSVDGVDFLEPIEVGELVSLHASVNYVGRTSMVVGIKVIAENVVTGACKHTNTSYFTMVAKDSEGRLREAPGLVLESREEIRRYLEAIKRRELKAQYREQLNNEKTRLAVDSHTERLAGERCVVRLREDSAQSPE
ncbi:acyl-CoA thioesterase [Capsulimonas corticalis]|uniref:Acyl-CoA thioesterase n=1 Tax=Capsulimonas corticalis TaxID=2219043 RepID=A0A402CUI7_9BACT|nr:acyl-CoA thioesterase [Capsulimonas corticalis]BDI28996.1 acyl-CoA thioesterase [Capsulimonas corticalis]